MNHSQAVSPLVLYFVVFLNVGCCWAQCPPSTPTPAPQQACAGGAGQVTNGANINPGQTMWWPASSTGTRNNINLNGGRLLVCGNLTISNINWNGGTIVVMPGATLTMPSFHMNGNASITNYGSLNIGGAVVMQNSNNSIINATASSVINMVPHTLQISSTTSHFVNNGTANFGTLIINSNSGIVCFGPGASVNTNNLVNNRTNSITISGPGPACIRVTGDAQMNNALTADPDFVLCRAEGSTQSGGPANMGNTGAATVRNPCHSCLAVLPAELLSLEGEETPAGYRVRWHVALAVGTVQALRLLRQAEGGPELVAEAQPSATAATHATEVLDALPIPPGARALHYTLQSLDHDGTVRLLGSLERLIENVRQPIWRVVPVPARTTQQAKLVGPTPTAQLAEVLAADGRVLMREHNVAALELADMAPGFYWVRILDADGNFHTLPLPIH